MPSFFNSYWGLQSLVGSSVSDATLTITDGDLEVDFTQSGAGWYLTGPDGWRPGISALSATYNNSAVADGEHLKHTKRSNVTETWRVGLEFYSPNDLIHEIDKLLELLEIRAPRYWTDDEYNLPVRVEASMPGETNTKYFLLSQGRVTLPPDFWDVTCNLNSGKAFPIQISFVRQPFALGAFPGQAQGVVNISALQDWEYNLVWAEEDTTPTGDVFCFAETDSGVIYAGGASEILVWSAGSWAAATTAPVTLTADVTAAVVLANGDILFGESGRIIKLSSGTWSVETSEPTGQVWDIIEATDGQVYAADNGRIVKQDSNGTWAEDDDLPGGQVYSLVQSSTGRLFAGEVGRILQTRDEQTSIALSVAITTKTDDAEELDAGTMSLTSDDHDLFQTNFEWHGLRFQNVTIPQGAIINSAVVRFTAQENEWNTSGTIDIFCQDADNAGTFTSTANNISGRTTTTASVNWTNEQIWRKDRQYDTPDFTSVVQEVVDRAGWASGNAMVVIMQRTAIGADRDAWSYDGKPSAAPELVITYSQARAAGETWEVSTTLPIGDVRSLLAPACGGLLAGESTQILGSDDDGVSWRVIDNSTATNEVRGLYDAGSGIIYGGDNGNILKSPDCGANWSVDSTLPTGYVYDLINETSTGDLRAGDNGRFLILDASDTLSLGRSETDADEVYIANHHKTCNLSKVVFDRGGVFTDVFPAGAFPLTLCPGTVALNDALYFGVDTSLADSGPFNNAVLDIETPASAATSYTITWEYWNGAWVVLTVQDGTSQLSEVGVQSVHWRQPSDWSTTAVDGVTGYFVRARISALTGAFTSPTQANRDIYSAITPFVEMDRFEVEGGIEALAMAEIRSRSDNGGPGGTEPTLYATRLLMGLKETEDHTNFRAFLNFADEQNPDGVSMDTTVDADSATAEQADTNLSSATGRRVFFDASTAQAGAGLNNMADRVAIKLNTTIARDYYGTYKPFLRCYQSGGSAGEITVRLKVVSGTGGISSLTDTQPTASTTDHELIEFETPITLPVSSRFTPSDIGDETSITVQISTAASDADLYLYDIFLLPVGQVWVDSEDVANTANSAVENGTRLVVDSITIPKIPIRTLVQRLGTGLYTANYRVDSRGGLSLLKDREQRLWFMAARYSAVGGNVWTSEPEWAATARLQKTERWLLGRGL